VNDDATPHPPEEGLPDLDEARIPAGCQIDFYGQFGKRLCVESYDDVLRKIAEADDSGTVEFRVIAGQGARRAEVVRFTIDKALIGAVLEITDALEDRWKQIEKEQEEEAERAQDFTILPLGGRFGGGPGFFRLG
jgi:hypothetical protein